MNIKLGKANIYFLKDNELELYADAIQVKKQKSKRSLVSSKKENKSEAKRLQAENKSPIIVEIDPREKLTYKMDVKDIKEDDQLNRKRVNTDLVVLKEPDGTYIQLMEKLASGMSLEEITISQLNKFYGNKRSDAVHKVVVIADGAQRIRIFIKGLFGESAAIILDWYHLQKKVWELLTSIKMAKDKKQACIRQILSFLWEGKTEEALKYIRQTIKPIYLEKSLIIIR
ncbi:MAG: hypothetical protein Q8858_02075 [Bacteroidota bacterium]|nr:hypothetical protein [Bacteroidota bacterium]MDP4197437.1 hypothetical protein [Bacteroidota bacterium]